MFQPGDEVIESLNGVLLKGPQQSRGQPDNAIDIGVEPGHYRVHRRFFQGLVQVLPDAGGHTNVTFPHAGWDVRGL